ncbi:MAG: hypothetical protein LBU39_04050 [Desulfobulbaceae bacterium]|jgi:hypothetical protein|nr:hypothetical protein [Desulfobulbaceae bacterium]
MEEEIPLRLIHPAFIAFVDGFVAEVSKPQWTWISAMFSLGLNIPLVKMFGKPRVGEDIYGRHQVHREYLAKNCAPLGINPLEETPLLINSFFVLTNRFFYFDGKRDRKIFSDQMSRGRVDLKEIETIASERGGIASNILGIAINGMELCAIPFNGPSDAAIVAELFARMNGGMKKLLA